MLHAFGMETACLRRFGSIIAAGTVAVGTVAVGTVAAGTVAAGTVVVTIAVHGSLLPNSNRSIQVRGCSMIGCAAGWLQGDRRSRGMLYEASSYGVLAIGLGLRLQASGLLSETALEMWYAAKSGQHTQLQHPVSI